MTEQRDIPRVLLRVLVGTVAIAAAGRLSVTLPGTDVPQTAQTLAVLLVGVALGPVLGAGAVLTMLVAGALGAPVFAGGSAGAERLLGPTGGFLGGFVLAAMLAGAWASAGRTRSFGPALAGMLLAHALLILAGWTRLALAIGVLDAWSKGVQPFLPGALAKSLLAALVAMAVARSVKKTRP